MIKFPSEEKKVSHGSVFQFPNLLFHKDTLGLPKIVNSETLIYTMTTALKLPQIARAFLRAMVWIYLSLQNLHVKILMSNVMV